MPALLAPRMFPLHLAGIASLVLAGWLGWWQVGVWQEHRSDKADQLADAPAVPIDDVIGPDDPFPKTGGGQPVEVSGIWQTADTVYAERVDGGYWVVTPLRTSGGSAVLVVRGLAQEPSAAPITGAADLTGWLQAADAGGADSADLEIDRPDVVGAVNTSSLIGDLDYDLYGGFVIAKAPLEPGLEPVTPDSLPKPDAFTSLRNLLYGLEWWVFGAFAAFMWWRWARDLSAPTDA